MRIRTRPRLVAALVAAGLAIAPAAAGAATFTNGGAINTNDSTDGTPYPSAIVVSGQSGTVTDVNVRLNSFTHPRPFDVGIVLVGPGGEALQLMDAVTDFGPPGQPASNLVITIDDEAPTQMPFLPPLASTSYRPTNYVVSDFFPPPGPGLAYGNPGPAGGGTQTLSSIFDGTSPNGTWSLFVRDFVSANTGQIAGGWSLVFPDAPASSAAKKKKCKKGYKRVKGKCRKKK